MKKTITQQFYHNIRQQQRRIDNDNRYNYGTPPTPLFIPATRATLTSDNRTARSLWNDLWFEGEVACLFGDTNVGKSVLANQIALDIAATGRAVLYIDFENPPHQTLRRYAKFDQDGNIINYAPMPSNVIHLTVNPEAPFSRTCDTSAILDAIEDEFIADETPVVIIDDISHICPARHCTATEVTLKRLRHWATKYCLSVLIIAHAAKHRPFSPLNVNGIFGSQQLPFCFDSIFALGRSAAFPGQHYIKQLKSRVAAISFGADNVISAELQKHHNNTFLSFKLLGAGQTENQHLLINRDPQTMAEIIPQLVNNGWSTREIAAHFSISQSTAARAVKAATQQQCDNKPAAQHNTTPPTGNAILDAVNRLADTMNMPAIKDTLLSDTLPFAEWTPDNAIPCNNNMPCDPSESPESCESPESSESSSQFGRGFQQGKYHRYCLCTDTNPLLRFLQQYTSPAVLETLPNISLRLRDPFTRNRGPLRQGTLIYNEQNGEIGIIDDISQQWFQNDDYDSTQTPPTISQMQKLLLQAADTLIEHRDNPDFNAAAKITGIPASTLKKIFHTKQTTT